MEQRLTKTDSSMSEAIEAVIAKGDLAQLTPSERVAYYNAVCSSTGLNPMTQPFNYIVLNGRLVLYVNRSGTDQLRKVNGVNIVISSRERTEDIYLVTARATTPDGRTDESIGAVSIGNLKGDALANALMKAETKAKRRVTLSVVGLGWLDESERETIPNAKVVTVTADGEIVDDSQRAQRKGTVANEAHSLKVEGTVNEPAEAAPEPTEFDNGYLSTTDGWNEVTQYLIKRQVPANKRKELMNDWAGRCLTGDEIRAEMKKLGLSK